MSDQARCQESYRTRLLLGCAVVALTASAQSAWSQEASIPADAEASDNAQTAEVASDGGREVVLVTASRREESIQDTAAAVSAYLGDDFTAANVKSLVDLLPSSPNIQISTVGTISNLSIRGIGQSLQTAGADPGVAFHVDGVYLAETGLAASNFLDVQRVEVIRGPQGTLFGRNATGGAVNVIPNTPSADASYGLSGNLGVSPAASRIEGFVNGSVSSDDSVTGRLAFQQTNNRGTTRNLAPNGPPQLNDLNSYALRGQLMWEPFSIFSTRLSLDYQNADSNGPGAFYIGVPDPTIPLPAPIAGNMPVDPADRETYANYGRKEIEGFGATLISELALPSGDLKATLAYNTTGQFTLSDGDASPVDFTHTVIDQFAKQHFAELLYTSDTASSFTYIAGANFFSERRNQHVIVPISTLPVPVDLGSWVDTTSYAAFVRGDYAFDFGLTIFAGARATTDEKEIDEFNNFVGTLQQEDSWSKTTYEIGASYEISPSLTGYAKYATGYKGGGYSGGALTPAFNPETNELIEAGLKGSYFDGNLSANLSAFQMKYDDLQVSQIVGVSSSVTNAAKATINGVEVEAIAYVSPSLQIEFAGGYLDATFDEFLTADSARPSLGALDLSGNRLPLAPEWTGRGAVVYEIPVNLPGSLTGTGEYTWKSDLYFSEFNIPVASQEAVGRLNLNLVYESLDGSWSIGAYARNVTDETVKTNVGVVSALLGSVALARLEPGREIGVSFSIRN